VGSKTLVLFVSALALCGAFAQAEESMMIMGFDMQEIMGTITGGMAGVGLVPDFKGACESCESVGPDCEYGVECNPSAGAAWGKGLWEWGPTRAFFIIFFLVWMVFSIAVGIGDLPSAILSFFSASFLFNALPPLFVPGVAQGMFEYAFSALFMFIWVDYLLRYMWAMTQTTKLLLDAAITMMAIMFMNITNIFETMELWISSVLSVWGLVLFFVFMIGMKFFNTFSSLMNIQCVREMRTAGASDYGQARTGAEKEIAQREQIRGGGRT